MHTTEVVELHNDMNIILLLLIFLFTISHKHSTIIIQTTFISVHSETCNTCI